MDLTSYETLGSIGEMKLSIKFYLCLIISLSFKVCFLESRGKLFSLLFQEAIDTFSFKKM